VHDEKVAGKVLLLDHVELAFDPFGDGTVSARITPCSTLPGQFA
jgi:hypothetical protein